MLVKNIKNCMFDLTFGTGTGTCFTTGNGLGTGTGTCTTLGGGQGMMGKGAGRMKMGRGGRQHGRAVVEPKRTAEIDMRKIWT